MKAIAALIVRFAKKYSGWGYCRIQGELKDLGHRHAERAHQGIGNVRIEPTDAPPLLGTVKCRERLGGILKNYYRAA